MLDYPLTVSIRHIPDKYIYMMHLRYDRQRSAAAAASSSSNSSTKRRCCVVYDRHVDLSWTIALVMIFMITLHASSKENFSDCNYVHAWTSSTSRKNICYFRSDDGRTKQQHLHSPQQSFSTVVMMAKTKSDNEDVAISDKEDSNMKDDDIIDTNESSATTSNDDEDYVDPNRKRMEQVWRYNKKPLLSIGAQKGPTSKHGNSLRELLQHHTTVKVKIQLLFNASNRNSDAESVQEQMKQVYEQLKDYAIQSDPALQDMELLQVRVNERILLVGLPGTQQKILDGTYPPPPPPPKIAMEDETTTTTTATNS